MLKLCRCMVRDHGYIPYGEKPADGSRLVVPWSVPPVINLYELMQLQITPADWW